MSIRLGNAPTSWGVEKELDTNRPDWDTFLDEVQECGYQGVELGPYGYLPTDVALLSSELSRRRLELTAGYVMGPLHTPEGASELLAEAKEVVPLLAAAGAAHLVVIPGISAERAATAGWSDGAPRLGADEFATEVATVQQIAEMAAAQGIKAGLHPHAGSYVEFADEIDRLLGALSPELVSLVLDTGHFEYAGIDPGTAIRDYGQRVSYVHLKDVSPRVLAESRKERMSFWQAYSAGIFCVLGTGCNDFRAIKESLMSIKYDGWLTVEQDADPAGKSDPRTDAVSSLQFLRQIGMVS
jgi:inosose dehydratase